MLASHEGGVPHKAIRARRCSATTGWGQGSSNSNSRAVSVAHEMDGASYPAGRLCLVKQRQAPQGCNLPRIARPKVHQWWHTGPRRNAPSGTFSAHHWTPEPCLREPRGPGQSPSENTDVAREDEALACRFPSRLAAHQHHLDTRSSPRYDFCASIGAGRRSST